MSKSGVSDVPRRLLLQRMALLLGLGTVSGSASVAVAESCAAPDGSDSSLRKSLHYAESSPDPKQKCADCGFFSEPRGQCGQCAIFSGPANLNGHCDSWAARS